MSDSPQELVARARELIQSRGGAMNAENLNRAMLMLRGSPDEGFLQDVATSAVEGRPRPRARRNAPTPTAQASVQAPATATRTETPPQDGAASTSVQDQPVQAATRGPRFTASMSGGMDPLLGIAITGDVPQSATVVTTPRGAARASTEIAPNRGDPTQSDPPGTPTGPAASRLSSTGQALRRAAGFDEEGNVTGLPRSMVDAILGGSPGLRVVRGTPGGAGPTAGPPAIPPVEPTVQGPVERMNVPARMYPNPPPQSTLPAPGGPTGLPQPTPPSVPTPSPAALPGPRSTPNVPAPTTRSSSGQTPRTEVNQRVMEMLRRRMGGGQ